MNDLTQLTALEMTAGFRREDFTPVDVTRAALDAIEEHDGVFNAFVATDPDGALEEARASQARWSAGEQLGAGDGIPTGVKDIFPVRGWPTLRGSWLSDETQPAEFDAPNVARLREAGGVLLGRVTTPEFAWKATTDSLRHGATANPYDSRYTSGGSSGGSAVAVGLGMGPWSVGTDAGGSVRIPGAFTGTVGFKPTYGLIPMFPASPFGTLAHAGPMTRTVTDAAALMDIITGFDSRDWSALPTPTPNFTEKLDDGVAGMRIGYSTNLGLNGTITNDSDVEARFLDAVGEFERLGARVERIDPQIADPTESFQILWFAGAGKVVEGYGPGAIQHIDPVLRQGLEEYGEITASAYLAATAERMAMGAQMGKLHETYDLLLTPTMPIPAFPLGSDVPDGCPSPYWPAWTPYTTVFNMTQQPAISVPGGFTDAGLPVGLQVIGARHADRTVLRGARAYEQAVDWGTSRPVRTKRADDAGKSAR